MSDKTGKNNGFAKEKRFVRNMERGNSINESLTVGGYGVLAIT